MKAPSRFARALGTVLMGTALAACALGLVLPFLADRFPSLSFLDPERGSFDAICLAPGTGPHLLGTDDQGRDCLSRLVAGSTRTLGAALAATLIAAALGVPLGLAAGASPAWDAVLTRLLSILMAFPALVLAIGIVSAAGAGLATVAAAAGVVGAPAFARLVRARVLVERERDYVAASRALGASSLRILYGQILPNVTAPILALSTLSIGAGILEIAGLGFLGLGVEPGTPEWGTDIAAARNQFLSAPWTILAPGLAISLTVLGFNLAGDRLEARLSSREP